MDCPSHSGQYSPDPTTPIDSYPRCPEESTWQSNRGRRALKCTWFELGRVGWSKDIWATLVMVLLWRQPLLLNRSAAPSLYPVISKRSGKPLTA